MIKVIHLVLWVCLLGVLISPAHCRSFRYTLHSQRADAHHILINVYDHIKAKAVWQHSLLIEDINRLNFYGWSKDHNALAIAEEHSFQNPGGGFRLWVWRSGEPLQVFTQQEILHRAITAEQTDWSSDKRYLLLRFSEGTAGAETNSGSLWLLDLKLTRLSKISNLVSEARWVSARSIQMSEIWINSPDTWNQHEVSRRYTIKS